MEKYDYVSRKEVKKYIRIFQDWMISLYPAIKQCGISFTYQLVGSAKRNLVVRHHNQGFDCDFQIFITKNQRQLEGKVIKQIFIDNLNRIVAKEGFSFCENSKSAITIKKVNQDESKIKISYDIVIIEKRYDNYYILRIINKGQQNERYVYELLPEMKGLRDKILQIKGISNWGKLRTIYYKKKTNNIENKKAYQLFYEAVNETINCKKRNGVKK